MNASRDMSGRTTVMLTLAFLLVAACKDDDRTQECRFDQSAVTAVTLHSKLPGVHGRREVRISDPSELRGILETLRELKPKQPCLCLHTEGAVFEREQGPLRVSLCSHCFDFRLGPSRHYCEMPPAFYAKFLKALEERGQPVEP